MTRTEHAAVEKRIRRVIDEEIKPLLAMHLGSLEYAGFANGIVKVRFQGTCVGCPLAQLTLTSGVEKTLKSRIREVKSVESVPPQ